jgi:hypothetical protein
MNHFFYETHPVVQVVKVVNYKNYQPKPRNTPKQTPVKQTPCSLELEVGI